MSERKNQYKWDGSDEVASIFQYSHSLGPRDTMGSSSVVMSLSKEDVKSIIELYRSSFPSVVIPEALSSFSHDLCRSRLTEKIDDFLSKYPYQKWFVKTNRHSCKDSPLDHPLPSDLRIFSSILSELEFPSLDIPLESLDFGPCFEAMCIARLHATAVEDGQMTVSLLERSKRIHDDLTLQLEVCPDPWDCYLSFSPFNEVMSLYPLHEFRCYVSRHKLRCIAQYSYLIKCPIEPKDIQAAINAIALCVENDVLPTLPKDIIDVAIDIQCVPSNTQPTTPTQFTAHLIEVNPLGPGTVWGHLHWETDKNWLLSEGILASEDHTIQSDEVRERDTLRSKSKKKKCVLPKSGTVQDSVGGKRCIEWYGRDCNVSAGNEYGAIDDGLANLYYQAEEYTPSLPIRDIVIVLYTGCHPIGLELGALAHVPSDYLLEIWNQWRIEERPNSMIDRQCQHQVDTKNSGVSNCVVM